MFSLLKKPRCTGFYLLWLRQGLSYPSFLASKLPCSFVSASHLSLGILGSDVLLLLMCISGINLRLSNLQTWCFSPIDSFHQHHCWFGGLCCLPPRQWRQTRESYVQTELVWKAECGLTFSACIKSQHGLWSLTRVHSLLYTGNIFFNGGIENLSLVMYHIFAAVTVLCSRSGKHIPPV